MSPEELKALRLKRGWKLRDVAIPLGVTEATLSRWERGLQIAPHAMLASWEGLLTGRRISSAEASRKRKPRGVIPRLAELFLADVQGGKNGWQAGWREISELNLTTKDLDTLEGEVERDAQGRIRIRHDSRLVLVQQAQNILGYRNTLNSEEGQLLPAVDKIVRPLLRDIRQNLFGGAVLLAGLTKMIEAGIPQVEAARNLLMHDPKALVEAPSQASALILETLGISFPSDVQSALASFGFEDLSADEPGKESIEGARAAASELGLDVVAKLLGPIVVTSVAAAWAVNGQLTTAGIAVTTDEGARFLGGVFWDEIRIRRAVVDETWRRVMIDEFEPQAEQEQLGLLLWSWPEVI